MQQQNYQDLQTQSRDELVEQWQRIHGAKLPPSLSKSLLIRSLTHRLQEQESGGLSGGHKKLLDSMIGKFGSNPDSLKLELQIKIGTRLRRLWQGKVYEVTTVQDGFIYDGTKYGSLSEIARLITKTRWNGRVFFGLKSTQPQSKKMGRAA